MDSINFEPNTTNYNSNNAYFLAKAAQLAGRKPQVIESTIKHQYEMPNFNFISKQETNCFVAGDDKKIIISFRGTEPEKIQDWMTDFQIRLVDQSLGKVHCGFLTAINYVWNDIVKTVKTFQTQNQTIWLTGHSLGGALATLAIVKMDEINQPVHGLYTFGQPRVGCNKFAQTFNLRYKSYSFRFVNHHDIVTRVPFSLLGYSHIGTFFHIDADQKLHQDINLWNEFKDRIKVSIEDLSNLALEGIKDHRMDFYISGIQKNLVQNPISKEITLSR